MRGLLVLAPGFQSTVQDLGRFGHGESGVSAAGAADPLALRLANGLLGNPEGAPGLEMTLTGGSFLLEVPLTLAIAGSDFQATLDGSALPGLAPVRARAGQTLSFGPTRDGARAYLCVRGGLAVPRVLGSASTHLLTKIGGVGGRVLRAGDALEVGPPPADPARPPLDPAQVAALRPPGPLRVTRGLQADWFTPQARALLREAEWQVQEGSDRTGLRLAGPALPRLHGGELLTEGAPLGAIQVPPEGGPIVLFVDHQTTGGYPKIANVAAVDLPRVGQLRPRDRIRFEEVDLDTARALLAGQEEALLALLG